MHWSTKAKKLGVDLRAGKVTGFEANKNSVDVALADGGSISARLLVGADGAHSVIREQAGITSYGWNYDQSAIVTTVGTSAIMKVARKNIFSRPGPSQSCR